MGWQLLVTALYAVYLSRYADSAFLLKIPFSDRQIDLDGYLKMNGWEDDPMGVGISDTHHMIGWVKYAYNARGQKCLNKSFYVKLDSRDVIAEIIYCESDVHLVN